MNVLVGDLLHVADLTPDISGVDSVSTVTSMSGLERDGETKTTKSSEQKYATLELGKDQQDQVCQQDSKMIRWI